MNIIDSASIQKAVALLRQGELVALPTETVYGLGADARNPEALKKIFVAKERPFTHPVIVHLPSIEALSAWAIEIPDTALELAQAFWPGPLTLILKKQPSVSPLISAGQDTIGLRIPAHPVAAALLQAFGDGIAAPSANRFTHLSPTTAQAVREELGTKIAYVLEGGACPVGLESTIVDLSRGQPCILRPGMISNAQLEAVLHTPLGSNQKKAPRTPGMHALHYAPETRLSLIASAELPSFLQNLTAADLPLAVLVQDIPAKRLEAVHYVKMSKEPQHYARDLYQTLRHLDKQGFQRIVVETPPLEPGWEAIHDRLQKAAGR